MKTLVLGMGNPILSDDSAGLRVVREVERRLEPGVATVAETNVAGLGLLDELNGYDRAVIVDAMQKGEGPAGRILRLDPNRLEAARHVSSPHDVDFATALEIGRRLGMSMPGTITIFGIEIGDATTFSEECTPLVEQAIPLCAELVLRELGG